MYISVRIPLLFLFICLFVFTGYAQTTSITLEMKNNTLKEIARTVETKCNYTFVFNENLNMEQRKDISIYQMPIDGTLKQIFGGTGISWQIEGSHIILNKAKKITISGYVTDQNSMETLLGAAISDRRSGAGNFTNSYGYYSIQVMPDSVNLQASYIGFKPLSKSFYVQNDTIVNFRLKESSAILQDVTVYNTKSFSPSSGSIELSGSETKPIPAAFSENDILKSFQAIPGVRAGVEGSAGMYVRGGSPDQNLILIDGVPVYNTGHMWGIFSVFNGDAVKKVSLHKGSFPARFSGRLSSVVDIRFKDGDMQKFHGDFTVSLFAARMNIEGPIVKGKTSYSFSARRSYIDAIQRITYTSLFPNGLVYIYDMNAKINHKFSDRSRLYLSYYSGRDKLDTKSDMTSYEGDDVKSYNKTNYSYGWGNDIMSLRWNYVINNKLFMNNTLAYNKYKFNFRSFVDDKYEEHRQNYAGFQRSGIKDWQLSSDFEYQPDNNHYFRFGGGVILHQFSPEMHGYQVREMGNDNQEWKLNYYLYDKIRGQELSLYAEDEFFITKKLRSNLGLHFSVFNVQSKTYLALQPRVSLGYELSPKVAVKASYTKMNQFVNLLSSNTISQPTDLWVPITKKFRPMSSHQFTGGLFVDTKSGYNFSVEGFYKRMNNVLEYKDGVAWKDAFTSWVEYVESGKGWSYGMELFAQKTKGRFTGWMGYTLSWNERRFKTINKGRLFPAKYDSRHNFNITGTFQCSKKIALLASWVYATGSRSTLPLEEYQPLPNAGDDPYQNYYGYPSVKYISGRNNYKMSDTHHLDLELKYYRSPRKIWALGVYNVYGRLNPYMARVGGYGYNDRVIIESSLLGVVPSVSFTYKFK